MRRTRTDSPRHRRPRLSIGELLARAARRDPFAWEEIISRYNGLVWARVRSFRLQDADAVDAVQMTWLRLAENCGRMQHPDRLGGWLSHHRHPGVPADPAPHQADRAPSTASPTPSPTPPPARSGPSSTPKPRRRCAPSSPNYPRAARPHPRHVQPGTRRYTEISRDTGIPIGSLGPTRARALHQLRRMLDRARTRTPRVRTRDPASRVGGTKKRECPINGSGAEEVVARRVPFG